MHTYNALTGEDDELENAVTTRDYDDTLILSIPHPGVHIPHALKDAYRIDRELLIGTDLYTDELYDIPHGTQILFHLNNYVVNANRPKTPREHGPASMTRDPLHGHGLLTDEKLLQEEHDEDTKNALLAYYDAYHARLRQLIEEVRAAHGYALIIDCHACNSRSLSAAEGTGERADFILSDGDGQSCSPELFTALNRILHEKAAANDWSVAANDPFTGGYNTRHYGNPDGDVHVIQVETKKALYMDEGLETTGFARSEERLARVRKVLAESFEEYAAYAKKHYS